MKIQDNNMVLDNIDVIDILDDIIHQIGHKIDIVVGITRGGLIPATMLSYQTGSKMVPVSFSRRSGERPHKDEIIDEFERVVEWAVGDEKCHVLVVDNMNRNGQDFAAIVEVVSESFPELSVETATICENVHTTVHADYVGKKVTDDVWVTFPWQTNSAI